MGRPLKYETPEKIQEIADKYFEETPIEQWTITGLAIALDTNRQTLMNYEAKDEFFDTIKRIKTKVEHSYELALRKKGGSGEIFGLKNFGWKDKQEVEQSGGLTLTWAEEKTYEADRKADQSD
jgi:hypothetical protein